MSIVTTLDVFCDGPGCGHWVDGVTGTRPKATEARSAAARSGWHHRSGRDLCPDCAKREAHP